MYRLTENRKKIAKEILDKYTRELHDKRYIPTGILERELRDIWDLGYKTLKDIMIDILEHHPEYAHLAAYYMEYSNAPGPVCEFHEPLAKLYGLKNWYYDDNKESKKAAYWEKAFAVISQFDISEQHDGKNILQISFAINELLVDYFLKNPKHLHSMNPRNFEELIAELFDSFGYAVELTQQTRDGGRDIIAINNNSFQVGTAKYLIECKRYAENKKVGILPVRALYGVLGDEKATKGIIVTTSSFTDPAKEFLDKHKWELEGHAFDRIVEWLKQYQQLKFHNLGLSSKPRI